MIDAPDFDVHTHTTSMENILETDLTFLLSITLIG